MNFVEQFAALTVATVKADRQISPVELDTISRLAEELDLKAEEVSAAVNAELSKNTSAEEVAKQVSNVEDKNLLLESCIVVALADNVLQEKEVDLLSKLTSALGLPQSKLVLTIAAVCQNNRAIKIDGNDAEFLDEILLDD